MNKKRQKYAKDCWDVLFPNGWDEETQVSITHKEFLGIVADGYNLALEDVRKEVERLTDKMKNAQTPTETHKCYQGGRLLGYEDVLNFLNQLSK